MDAKSFIFVFEKVGRFPKLDLALGEDGLTFMFLGVNHFAGRDLQLAILREMDCLDHKVVKNVVPLAVVKLHLQKLLVHHQEKYQILITLYDFLEPQNDLPHLG